LWIRGSLAACFSQVVPAAGSGSAGEAATAVAAKCRHPPSREAERPSLDITDCCKNSSVESSDLVRRGLSQAGPYTG